MPTLDLDHNQAKFQIRAYQPGWIQINEERYTASLIISANELMTDWQPQSVEELTTSALDRVMTLKPDILIIGTGSKHVLLPVSLYGHLINHGIGVEVMETGAACRTYNALTAENRRVVAALLLG